MSQELFIDNHWTDAGGESFASVSPIDPEKIVWQGLSATQSDVEHAFSAARRAFESWSETSLNERFAIARTFSEIVKANAESFAETISVEMGKPLWESKTEVGAVAGKVELAIDALQTRRSTTTTTIGEMNAVTRYKPHGVMGVLGPFNLPAHLPNGHIVPAILAGNTVVFKPSELTPQIGEIMIQYWEEAGIPPGVINLVQGGRETGIALSQAEELDGLLFTGSSRAGIALNTALASQPQKIVALEMGGNNPLIVHQSGDLKAAAYQTLLSAFITSGQRCTCARRLYLVDGSPSDRDETNRFLQELCELITKVRVGFFNDPEEPFIGPVINHETGLRLQTAQKELLAAGAKTIVPMKKLRDCDALLSPGVLDVTDVANIDDEELFGPLLQVFRVQNFQEAIQKSNQSKYGLSAGLISDSRELYDLFIRKIRAGVVNWNRQTTGASGKLPFGGCGLSGNHRPSGYFAADYCSFPVASLESGTAELPETAMTGIEL